MMFTSWSIENAHVGQCITASTKLFTACFGKTATFSRGSSINGPDPQCQPELLLTLRAQGLSTHGGEVAFPGGRRDPEDADLISTALREAQEEVGLSPGLVEVVGPLSEVVSRHAVKVTPYVGIVPDYVEYRANADEIDSVFSVPLDFFASDPREITHRIDYWGVLGMYPVTNLKIIKFGV